MTINKTFIHASFRKSVYSPVTLSSGIFYNHYDNGQNYYFSKIICAN